MYAIKNVVCQNYAYPVYKNIPEYSEIFKYFPPASFLILQIAKKHPSIIHLARKNVPIALPEPGMQMVNLARAEKPLGDPLMDDNELSVFISNFESSWFTGSINWYRDLDRNWHLMADVSPIIHQPTLMIYGNQDTILKSENLKNFVTNLDIVSLDCGHWIQQEKPEETSADQKLKPKHLR